MSVILTSMKSLRNLRFGILRPAILHVLLHYMLIRTRGKRTSASIQCTISLVLFYTSVS